MNKLFIFLLFFILTYQAAETITMNPNDCKEDAPYRNDGNTECVDKNEIICHSKYYIMGTTDICQDNCNVSNVIYPYLLYKNGEYICVPLCKDFGQYLDASDSSNPRCVERCPEYQHFILPNDADDKENECLAKCPEEESNNHPYAFLKDNLFECQSKDVCTKSNYIDELTSDTFKYCVPSCLTIHRTAFISVEKKCVNKCEDGQYIDYSEVKKPKCIETCVSPKHIDSLTNSTHPACVDSCYTLDPPAYIGLNNHCVRECNGLSIDFSAPQNPKCVATCPTSDPKTYKDSDSYSNPICVLSCWDQKLPKYIDADGNNCVEECTEGQYIDNLSDRFNPKCVLICPTITIDGTDYTTYKDALTNSDYPTCVFSCKKLQPSAVINKDGNECISTCPSNQYINDIEALHPQCIADCSTNTYNKYIHHDGESCVRSCRLLYPMSYLNSAETKCQETCDNYVDTTSVKNEFKCVDSCPKYINTVRGIKYCVDSCLNLNPSKYIDGKNCVLDCTKYLDSISDSSNPKCVDSCSEGEFIDAITYKKSDLTYQKVCTKSCRRLHPTAFVYKDKDDSDLEKCTLKCPDNWKLQLSSENNEYYCVNKCSDGYFIDKLTIGKEVCVPSCRKLVPEAYVNSDTNECTRACPSDKLYLLVNSEDELVCSAQCDRIYKYIDNVTLKYPNICVTSCKKQTPTAYIYEDKDNIKHCKYCKDTEDKKYVNALQDPEYPVCTANCPQNTYIDTTVGSDFQLHCVRLCKNLNPTAYIYKDENDDNKEKCVQSCKTNTSGKAIYTFIDPMDKDRPRCVSECPTHYYIDSLTDPDINMCVLSCKNLKSPAYINKEKTTCVKNCSTNEYIDSEDEERPTCVVNCPTNYYKDDITNSSLKVCVPSCKNLIPSSYIYENKCHRSCKDLSKYVDPEDPDRPTCADKCPENYYLDEDTFDKEDVCVPSCKNLVPTAYIYQKDGETLQKCVRKCSDLETFNLIDTITDEDFPRCVKECPKDTYKDVAGIFCVKSCKNQYPVAYLNADGDQCVKSCTNYIDAFTNPDHPQCTDQCPDDHYIDTVNKICVPSCKNLQHLSYIYKNSSLATTSKLTCVPFGCPDNNYIDTTDPDRPTCVTSCPQEHYIYSTSYYVKGNKKTKQLCVSSCKNQDPTTYIYNDSNVLKCVDQCPDSTYVDESTDPDNPTCVQNCPEGYYIDELTDANRKTCVKSCRNLSPTAFISGTKCVRVCLSNKVVDYTDYENPKCADKCPNNWYKNKIAQYYYNVTWSELSVCVTSCKNLIPTAYIYDDAGVATCKTECPSDKKYIDAVDPDYPKCVANCPENYFIDKITDSKFMYCVPSCLNLRPTTFIFADPSNGDRKTCITNCSVNTNAKYVDMRNKDHPECVTQCPTNYFIDTYTIEGQNLCVPSCKELESKSIIDNKSDADYAKCVKLCPAAYPYIDALTDSDYPTCVDSCGENHIHTYKIQGETEELTVYECVASCIEFDQYIYIDTKDSSKTKCKSVCPDGLYVDYHSSDKYFKNPQCVSECSEGYYVDNLTNSQRIFCRPSCKELTPLAYIDTSDLGFMFCARNCNGNILKYIDETTDVDHPKCVSTCPSASKYIYDTEETGLKYCVESCRLTKTKPLIDEITTPKKPDCVESCRKTAPYLDEVSDPAYPKCLQKCPETAKYLDLINNPEIPVCLDQCQDKAPYHDAVTVLETPKCVIICPAGTYESNFHCLACQGSCKECKDSATYCISCVEKTYFDTNSNSCLEVCPDGYYGDSSDWICKECYLTCYSCLGKLDNQCTGCNDDYILTSTNECIDEKKFIADSSNLNIENITSFDQLDTPIEQIKNIGNLINISNTSSQIQNYMINTMTKIVTYVDEYVKTQEKLDSVDKQEKISKNLQKITDIKVQFPVDPVNDALKQVIDKIDTTKSNETIVENLFSSSNNILKYMKNGSKNFNNSQASYASNENDIFASINKIGDIGLKVLIRANIEASRRMLAADDFQHFTEFEEFSMLLESHDINDEKWISEVKDVQDPEDFFFYEQREKIDYKDMVKVAVNYPKSFVEQIKAKVDNSTIEKIYSKVISYNALRESNSKYMEDIAEQYTILGSVIEFSFKYKLSGSTELESINLDDINAYINVKVPLNYKLNGHEDLRCMTYDEDKDQWHEDNIVTAEKTDTYVVCRARQLNAITVIDVQEIEFKKNYAVYLAFGQILFCLLIFILMYFLSNPASQGQKALSFSPLFSGMTACNGAHLMAKMLLFLFQLSLIEFFVAFFYCYDTYLNQQEIHHIVLCIVYSLLINYGGKYIFGFMLAKVSDIPHSCVIFTLFMSVCYTGLCFGACYFVYYPDYDKFYNIGLETTFFAFIVDFIIFDMFIALILLVLKFPDEKLKLFTFGGYLSLNKPRQQITAKNEHCISEDPDAKKKYEANENDVLFVGQ